MMATFDDKRIIAEGFAKSIRTDTATIDAEKAKALVEETRIAEVQAEVILRQADASKELQQAEPALVRAMAALEALDRRDLGNCKTMNKGTPSQSRHSHVIVTSQSYYNHDTIIS